MVTFQAMRKGLIGFGQLEKGVHFSTNEKRINRFWPIGKRVFTFQPMRKGGLFMCLDNRKRVLSFQPMRKGCL